MTGLALDEFNLLRMCRGTLTIPGPSISPAKQHPLGLGIRLKQEYKLRQGSARLPKAPTGLVNLRETTGGEIPFLQPGLESQAWGALLDRPILLAETAAPSADRLAPEGILVSPTAKDEQLRELLLGVVIRSSDLSLEGGRLSSLPIGGVARLLLETSQYNRAISADAWISAKWTSSTVEFIANLEEFFLDAPAATQKTGHHKTAAVLLEAQVKDAVGKRLVAAAAICGYDLTIIDESGIHDAAVKMMRSASPSELLVQSSLVNDAYQVIELYRASSTKRPILVPAASSDGVLTVLRARLHEAAGISAILLPFGQEAPSAESDGYSYITRDRLPVKLPGKKARHSRFKVIQECCEAKLWYSRDLADHSQTGTVAFKAFKADAKGLHWVADLDENGKIIESKHKGPTGIFIPWKELSLD